MVKHRSVGGLVFKPEGGKIFWLVGKHSGYHKWILPKGKVEKGEDDLAGVKREVKEETGVAAQEVEKESIFQYEYFYYEPISGVKKQRVHKTVVFYLLRFAGGDTGRHDFEMSDVRWLETSKALQTLAFPKEREALKRARRLLWAKKLV